jgi:antitoxin HicB
MTTEPRYPIVLYPAEEGGYVAEIPVLRGCLAQGETPEECLNELAKVQALWIETAKRNNEKLPSAQEVIAKLRKMVA